MIGMSYTFFLSGEELAATKAKLDKLNARASSRGFAGRVELEAVPAVREFVNSGGIKTTHCGFDVTLTGEPPKYGGWKLLAAVDNVGDYSLVRQALGVPDGVLQNEDYDGQSCDHCKTSRRRKHTYVVQHEDGRILQVGKTCLQDFLGWSTAPVFLSDDEIAADVFVDFGDNPTLKLEDVVRIAFAATDAWGYHNAYSETPTRDVVETILSWSRGAEELDRELWEYYPDDEEIADRLNKVESSLDGETGYEQNLLALIGSGEVPQKGLGFAVSIAAVWARLRRKELENAEAEDAHVSRHLGVIGEKIEVEGVVTAVRYVDGFVYNTTSVLVVLSVGEGDIVKMFTGAGWAYDVEIGDKVSLSARVKSHGEWNGKNETMITRPKLLQHVAA